MSDRSYFQLYVYSARKREQRKIVELIRQEGLICDADQSRDIEDLRLGELYYYDEMPVDVYETIGRALTELAPHSTFACWNDPKYEYPGGLYMQVPALGVWSGDCDSDGNPIITAYQVREILKRPADEVQPELRRLLGIAWEEAIEKAVAKVRAAAA